MALVLLEVSARVLQIVNPYCLLRGAPELYWEEWFAANYEKGRFIVGQGLHEVHPTRGWTPRADAAVREGDFTYRTNDRGLRSAQPYRDDSSRYTVMVLGDSFTFGMEASEDEIWPTVLQQRNPRLNVLNLGVCGYGLDQMYITERETIASYHPDLVLLAPTEEDLDECLLTFRDYKKPRFVIDKQNHLVLTNTPIGRAEDTYAELQRWRQLHLTAPRLISTYLKTGLRLPDEYALLKRIMEAAASTARTGGSDFLVAFLPLPVQISGDYPSPTERLLRQMTSEDSLDFFDMRPPFQSKLVTLRSKCDYSKYTLRHYNKFEHWEAAAELDARIRALPSYRRWCAR